MNTTPWPTNTSSSIVTPSQMKVWLEILQRAPIDGVLLDLDERRRRGSRRRSVQPYRFTKQWIATFFPRRTSAAMRRKLAGSDRSCMAVPVAVSSVG